MTSPVSPRAGRRASGAIRRMPQLASVLTPRTGVKALAGAGLAAAVAATLTLPVEAAPAMLASGSPTTAVTATPDAAISAARVADTEASSASRSRGRAPVAVQAPAAAGPQAATTYGVAGVTVVAKPTPKPVPTTGVDQGTEGSSGSGSSANSTGSSNGSQAKSSSNGSLSSNSSNGSSSSSSGSGYSTGSYSSAARALGLGPNAQRLYSAIRSQFGISNIGGYRSGDSGDHGSGRAVDVMTSSFGQGDAVAAFVQAHAGEFNVKYVIWKQRIWFPGRSGWRQMSDRGSATANHYDHVHISVN